MPFKLFAVLALATIAPSNGFLRRFRKKSNDSRSAPAPVANLRASTRDSALQNLMDDTQEENFALIRQVDLGFSFAPFPTLTPPAVVDSPTNEPTDVPSSSFVVANSTSSPTLSPNATAVNDTAMTSPTVAPSPSVGAIDEPCSLSTVDRVTQLLAIIEAAAANETIGDIRDLSTSQGQATRWLIVNDTDTCPNDDKLLQRWALAVVYFSTNGPEWFECFENDVTCGSANPFVGKQAFLTTSADECEWAGITCRDNCVTELEFEENNLVGVIPTEVGLLTNLAVWGMERGRLAGSIPSHVGLLSDLIFLDLDFNQLTGTLSAELLSLSSLTQLDLNNNLMSGSIEGVGVFPNMTFLQLHDNAFTGTVPASLGLSTGLEVFTLHETDIGGSMPAEVCGLLATDGGTGVLSSLIADCDAVDGETPDIQCACCTDCRST